MKAVWFVDFCGA